jgi:uracil-DNA glycosylase
MPVILQPDDPWEQLKELRRRIERLESSPRLTNSSLKEGSTTILDASGNQRVLIGKDPSDSSYGVKIYDAFGNPLLKLVEITVGATP